uniref:Uncharacterized protein n=1 Tax=Noccaea caerulescens TaxID=107243 RepID=A0A1J3ECY0_NOCCA
MASKALSPPAQPQTFQLLDAIDGQFCNQEAVVRLLHFWEARNFRKGNILMGADLLLLDGDQYSMENRNLPFKKMKRTMRCGGTGDYGRSGLKN